MKNLLTLFVVLVFASFSFSQDVLLERSSELMNELYTINGDAFLEELDDGTLQLRLSEDFNTPAGPDVRVFLNNSIAGGGIQVVNLSNIGHFNGALTVEVPSGVNIDDYQYIVFFCQAFNQLWASGEWSDSAPPGGGFVCEDNDVMLSNGTGTIDICPADGITDNLIFTNSLDLPTTDNYAYLLTDENEILQQVIIGDNFDFEGSSLSEQRIYGVHYDGALQPSIGSNRSNTTATGCAIHSSNLEYIEITKNACPSFDCFMSSTFTSNGFTSIDICSSDGQADNVTLLNNINEVPGEHYAYLVTDGNELLQEVVLTSNFDFEGSSDLEQRVYGVHFDGTLIPAFGANRQVTSASGCFTHSNDNNFLTITKNACAPEFVCIITDITSSTGDTELDICPSDGNEDIVTFQNSQSIEAGDHFAYLITDENEIVQGSTTSNSFDFEGTSDLEQRVYGVHYDGDLNIVIGQNRLVTTASGCIEHSSSETYITITKNSCPPAFVCEESSVTSAGGVLVVDICPTDGQDDLVSLVNTLPQSTLDNYTYLITDKNETVIASTNASDYNFEGSGEEEQRVYGVHYDGLLNVIVGANRMNTIATECTEHSSSDVYLTVTKNDCADVYECLETLTATTDWATSVDICPTDGESDLIALKNNLFVPSGIHYAYLITDADQVLQEVVLDTIFDFEGSSLDQQRVYGISYDGVLDVKLGEPRTETTASGCFIHSGSNLFLTVTKNSCVESYECLETVTATTDWALSVDICPTDGVSDLIELRNSSFELPDNHYAYLITGADEVLQEVVFTTEYDFEGSSLVEQRVYGISYDGVLDAKIGENRMETTGSECYIHSGSDLFLTINKSACISDFECVESLTATTAWVTNVDICGNDGVADEIFIQNNIGTDPGENYAFLLTDTFEVLQEVILDSIYDFEGLEESQYRIYGISYSGELQPAIGEDRQSTVATDCYIHSGGNLFITINIFAECIVSTSNIVIDDLVNAYPNPSTGSIDILFNEDADISNSAIYNIYGQKITNVGSNERVELISPGIYFLQVISNGVKYSKKIMVVK